MTLLNAVKELIIPQKDYAGRSIDSTINSLSARTNTNRYDWSYLHDEKIYVNTVTNMKIYPHELERKVA